MKSLFHRFFRSESSSGWLLLFCILVSLALANTSISGHFNSMLQLPVGCDFGEVSLRYSLFTWINDGFMALFFLLMGLEVKRAFLVGELSGFKKATLPVLAALGGCLVPALLFGLINMGNASAKGWAIPMATDIAFALTVLRIAIGNRAPSTRTFLSTLAIADDIAAILVIALFYSGSIHMGFLVAALGIFGVLVFLNRLGVKSLWYYLLPGLVLWYLMHHSGIHATIAGVLIAFTIPLKNTDDDSPLEKLEHALLTPVNFFILPLFAIANANVAVDGNILEGVVSPLSIGIMVGLLIGKPLGIMLFSLLAVKVRIGSLPDDMEWRHLFAVSITAGIGFTMSIFVSMLSYEGAAMLAQAKLAVLAASTLAGIIGFLALRRAVNG